MKKSKRITALILSVMMIASAGSVVSANAAEVGNETEVSATLTQGDYEYYVQDDGTVAVSKYNGKSTNVTIPGTLGGKKVTYLDMNSFMNNTTVTSITIPSGVKDFSINAFYGCTKLTKFAVAQDSTYYTAVGGVLFNKNVDTLYRFPQAKSGAHTIPSTVKTIYNSAFADCSKLTSVTISNGVSKIDWYAFIRCTGLKNVVLPDSVKTLDMQAFDGCTSLESVTLSNGLAKIGTLAFAGCTSLKKITIPSSVTTIEGSAFSGCESLESVSFPNSLKTIGNYAFVDCKKLNNVAIPYSVTSIGSCAFANNINLTSLTVDKSNSNYISSDNVIFTKNRSTLVVVPAGRVGSYTVPSRVKYIADGAFYGCLDLDEITLSNTVVSIGDYAFAKCGGLRTIEIPDSVTSIGKRAFLNCINLKDVKLSNSLEKISESMFDNCTKLRSIDVPASVQTIESNAFDTCMLLEEIKLHEGLKTIESGAFTSYSLKNIFIPKSVTTIADYAFSGPKSETTIYGYQKSAAETYAKNNNMKFVAVYGQNLTDKTTNISVSGALPALTTLHIKKVANTYKDSVATYDITLSDNYSNAVQPVDTLTISIPSSTLNCKVLWIKDDGTVQDMNAVYKNGCYVFETDHLSQYAIVKASTGMKGDVNKDGTVNVADATIVQKFIAHMTDTNGKQFIDVNNTDDMYAADVNGDGVINVADATLIQKYIVKLITSF